jgi:hypothetical protein
MNPKETTLSSNIHTTVGSLAVDAMKLGVGIASSTNIGKVFLTSWENAYGNNYFYTMQSTDTVSKYYDKTRYYTYTFVSVTDSYYKRYVDKAYTKLMGK